MLTGIEKFFIKSWEIWDIGNDYMMFYNKEDTPLEITEYLGHFLHGNGLSTEVVLLEIHLEKSYLSITFQSGISLEFPISGILITP